MGQLFPFRAYRYSPGAGPLHDLVTQPYDKITNEMRAAYLERHEYNIVRVIKNPDYQEAGRYLKRWSQDRVLIQDPEPSFYPYEQVFEFEGREYSRLGFVGLVSLQDPGMAVKGHERILREPLEDRLRLIRETESNEGLIFTLYSDPTQAIDQLLRRSIADLRPEVETTDEYGVIHRLWRLSDPRTQQIISSAVENLSLYIADGHHRFQTSVLFCQECLDKGWIPAATESFDKRLMALFNMEAPGLKILPTHRAVRNLPNLDLEGLLQALGQFFVITTVATPAELRGRMCESGQRIGLIATAADQNYLLELRHQALDDPSFMSGIGKPARELDVNLLHEGILRPYLRIGPEELASQRYVDYFRNADDLTAGVREARYQIGFLLNPTTLEQVRAVSEKGEKMPQKSTDFYPKLLTGLVIMRMEIGKQESAI
jgi:uncharacterized protein (DUF1015 family)